MSKIKRKKEFILAVCMIIIGLFLVFYKGIIMNLPAVDRGGYFNRPDVFIRFWALLMVLDSVVILIRSLVKEPEGGKEKPFYLDATIILIAASLLIYIFLLQWIGFIASTFLIVLFLNLMFVCREEHIRPADLKTMDRKVLLKKIGFAVIYSAVMVVVLYLVFAKALRVVFPS